MAVPVVTLYHPDGEPYTRAQQVRLILFKVASHFRWLPINGVPVIWRGYTAFMTVGSGILSDRPMATNCHRAIAEYT